MDMMLAIVFVIFSLKGKNIEGVVRDNDDVLQYEQLHYTYLIDVGKTIISAGISRAALKKNNKVCYIKPIQTGTNDFTITIYDDDDDFDDDNHDVIVIDDGDIIDYNDYRVINNLITRRYG